ncbi:unnamed protein product [Porites evermanni]|uniref:EGF-like domain-containing protein n=1 Tax=Porites evermanni TaxID=104178 RepID=A0ABN8SMN8_9CNID|nr:unnamed protein product [Porites evermanni]
MKNKALRNHVIKSFQEIEEGICELQCYLEPNCVSYNYGPSLCELNDMTHLEAQSSDMEERDGSIYRLISHNPCMSSPCLNGAACQTGFGCQGYRCACLQGYQGILCELDIDECTSQTHDCSPNSECTNMQGSFQCECKSGFTGDGKTCDG